MKNLSRNVALGVVLLVVVAAGYVVVWWFSFRNVHPEKHVVGGQDSAARGKEAGPQQSTEGREATRNGAPSKGIDSGLLFVDGKFIDPPYVVEIVGQTVMVNDAVVCRARPQPKRLDVPKDAPPLPGQLNSQSSFDEWGKTRHGSLMKKYLDENHSPDKARDLFLEYLRSLPFMERVEEDPYDEWCFTLFSRSGNKLAVAFPGQGRYGRYDPDEHLRRTSEEWKSSFQRGVCVFFSGEGGSLSFLAKLRRERLTKLMKVMRDDALAAAQKVEFMKTTFRLDSDMAEKFVETFEASPELERRIERLNASP